MPAIQIKRIVEAIPTVQETVEIGKDTIYRQELMGRNAVQLITVASYELDITLGDYIEVGTEKLYINQIPEVTRQSNTRLIYTIQFEADVYALMDKLFMDEGSADFSYFGQAEDFIDLLITNITEIDADWLKGVVTVSGYQTLTFEGVSCRRALEDIAAAFNMEYRITGKVIDLKTSVGTDTAFSFQYGKEKGLYELSRLRVDDKRIITRVYGFGGSKNLGYTYRAGAKRLLFEDLKLEANVANYGVREGRYIDDTIYPKRTGLVSAFTNDHVNKVYTVRDTLIDFDINDYKLEGVEAKIVFNSGELAGNEFIITKYVHSIREITYSINQEENDYIIPNATFEAAVGDEYTLVDIKMPASYIATAEAALEAAAQAYLDSVSVPQVTYQLDIDPLYVLQNSVSVKPGDRITVVDAGLGINSLIRINAVEYPLAEPSSLSCEIGNVITRSEATLTEIRSKVNKQQIVTVNRTSVELARQNNARRRQLQDAIFDPDGYFDPVNIKPESIETLMLTVGAKSQNFVLNGVEIEANYAADQNKLRISAGVLSHLDIEIDGVGSDWVMAAQTFTTLVTANVYYLYAYCSSSALTGSWKISTSQLAVDSEAGKYHFLLGILFAGDGAKRFFEITKGMTFINGETITTGKIQSQDGLSYLDLSNNTFKIGDASSSVDWGVTAPGTLSIKGAVMTDFVMAAFAYIDNLGVRFLKTSDAGQRIEIDGINNLLSFYDADGDLSVMIDDDLYDDGVNPYGGIIFFDKGAGSKEVIVSREGVRAKGRGLSEGNPALRGVVEGQLIERPGSVLKTAAAVMGQDLTTTGDGDTYGGWFDSLYAQGLRLRATTANTSRALTRYETLISCTNTSAITLTLDPKAGVYFIKRMSGAVTLDGGGANFYTDSVKGTTFPIGDNGHTAIVWNDGTYWQYSYMV